MRIIFLGMVIVVLSGCSMGHRDPVEAKQALNEAANQANSKSLDELPDSVQADLMPELDALSPSEQPTIKRFRVQANAVQAKAFFASLVKGTEYSVAVHPDVAGRITVNLTDVTMDEVINVVRDIYGYDVVKNGKVIQVYPAGLRTETIPVDYLQLKRMGRSLTSITNGSVSSKDDGSSSSDSSSSSSSSSSTSTEKTGGTDIETISESDFWAQLEKSVSTLIGASGGRSVVVSPQASVITIRAYPNEIREIRQFLDVSKQRLQRQVILETKILEVTLNDGYQQGIEWSNMSASIGGADVVVNRAASSLAGLDPIADLLGGSTAVTVSDGNFQAVLNFMATQGDLNVLSSPRVTAANNQKALIKVGEDEYFVTDVSSVVGSGDNANVAPDVELTPFFSGISLDVTPQIDDDGNVLLHVHPAVIDVTTEVKSIDLGDTAGVIQLPLAKSSIRESDTIIRASDGDVVVIGGLMKTANKEIVSKVPFLGDIPAIGHLFRNTVNSTEKTELVILLKPTVVGVNTWQQEIERSRNLLNEWFPEGQ
ncbi:pilus (MSHA type) biogenesis protein MshL [Vibrio sp. UCD-FRSSP16_10]|uniref:pilus (MSHA type) biogenesis protein MshL n=1 Tax=unclassified Vibrio TaxID=2614977 RepID=UPI0007FDB604|nr:MULTISPECIES: pilus (MSHA type) biogenesis protein MshL [unclassified Vibrio]OBT17479.1 pilus (MSHA type) biogenesis protein MshL [Vibrio sp. UCD-FRSSP16_30]OBT23248.1 pilus (MSHA type) biogenesis protein MshL [Vibrio sp. UCD-FRSSP16_10]